VSSTLIPPPLVALLVAASMWAVDAALPGARVIVPLRTAIVVLLSAVALALMVAAVAALWRARTTVNPLHPERASALVTDGIFARSRNPIDLGDVLLLAAWAVWLGNVAAAPLPALFVLWMARLQIPAEEAALRAHFGAAFEDYRRRVRRWL
jgi:protein-S-isoprenylcysteine O-methyltransferase Ste14